MATDYKEMLEEVKGRELKEWRSKQEFDNYLLAENRYGIIGYVKNKTLKKWGDFIDWRNWRNEEDMYVLQKGNKYYYIAFREGAGFLSK